MAICHSLVMLILIMETKRILTSPEYSNFSLATNTQSVERCFTTCSDAASCQSYSPDVSSAVDFCLTNLPCDDCTAMHFHPISPSTVTC